MCGKFLGANVLKSLRLAWLKRIFSINSGTWKSYLCHLLAKYVISMLKISQFVLNSMLNFCGGGLSFVKTSHQVRTEKI